MVSRLETRGRLQDADLVSEQRKMALTSLHKLQNQKHAPRATAGSEREGAGWSARRQRCETAVAREAVDAQDCEMTNLS